MKIDADAAEWDENEKNLLSTFFIHFPSRRWDNLIIGSLNLCTLHHASEFSRKYLFMFTWTHESRKDLKRPEIILQRILSTHLMQNLPALSALKSSEMISTVLNRERAKGAKETEEKIIRREIYDFLWETEAEKSQKMFLLAVKLPHMFIRAIIEGKTRKKWKLSLKWSTRRLPLS